MPEVVAQYAETRNLQECGLILDDLITSFRADFVKYKQHVPSARISEVFESVVHQAGGKFVYSRAATEANHKQVKEATELLIKAGLKNISLGVRMSLEPFGMMEGVHLYPLYAVSNLVNADIV